MKKIIIFSLIIIVLLISTVIGSTIKPSIENIIDDKLEEQKDLVDEKDTSIDISTIKATMVTKPICSIESQAIQMCKVTIEVPYDKKTYTFDMKYNAISSVEEIDNAIGRQSKKMLLDLIPDTEITFEDIRYNIGEEFELIDTNEKTDSIERDLLPVNPTV